MQGESSFEETALGGCFVQQFRSPMGCPRPISKDLDSSPTPVPNSTFLLMNTQGDISVMAQVPGPLDWVCGSHVGSGSVTKPAAENPSLLISLCVYVSDKWIFKNMCAGCLTTRKSTHFAGCPSSNCRLSPCLPELHFLWRSSKLKPPISHCPVLQGPQLLFPCPQNHVFITCISFGCGTKLNCPEVTVPFSVGELLCQPAAVGRREQGNGSFEAKFSTDLSTYYLGDLTQVIISLILNFFLSSPDFSIKRTPGVCTGRKLAAEAASSIQPSTPMWAVGVVTPTLSTCSLNFF